MFSHEIQNSVKYAGFLDQAYHDEDEQDKDNGADHAFKCGGNQAVGSDKLHRSQITKAE